jgi:hypothetical protein
MCSLHNYEKNGTRYLDLLESQKTSMNVHYMLECSIIYLSDVFQLRFSIPSLDQDSGLITKN